MDQQQLNDTAMVVRESVPSSDTVRVRFGEIDGLRAIAIIAALVFEATRIASPTGRWWPPFLARVYGDTSQGLSLFFLISGFVLAYPPFASMREDGRTYLDVGRYLVKRLLRIYPAYLVVLALTFVVPVLAMQYGLPALAHAPSETGWQAFIAQVFFVGSGLGNDGFRVLALEARWFLLLPVLLLVWSRFPKVFLGFVAVVMLADMFLAFIHATGAGTLAPFMLGMIAADIRAGRLRFERFAFPLAGIAALAAIAVEPFVANLPGPAGAPGALRIDALWTIALFALLVGAGTSGIAERLLSFRPLRFIGAGAYGIALTMVPVSGFIVRQTLSTMGQAASAANAIVLSTIAGLVIWQLADRWFSEGNLRREAAAAIGPFVDRVLRFARMDRVTLGTEPERTPYSAEHAPVDASFYAPPPRPEAGDLAVVSMRTGSADDLAAEIMNMKKRLSDRSTAIFADAEPVPEPEPEPAPEPFARPGFYRRSTDTPQTAAKTTPQPPAPPRPRIVAPPAAKAPAPPAPAKPDYEHYALEPAPSAPPPERSLSAVPPLQPAPPTSRGPIKMRIGALPQKVDGNDA